MVVTEGQAKELHDALLRLITSMQARKSMSEGGTLSDEGASSQDESASSGSSGNLTRARARVSFTLLNPQVTEAESSGSSRGASAPGSKKNSGDRAAGLGVRQALCVKPYTSDKEYHLVLEACAVVTLVKHEPKDELWYGECKGNEGYFPRDAVVLMPVVSPELLPPANDWRRISDFCQKLTFHKGDVICNVSDPATVGFLFIVDQGVCMQSDGIGIYFAEMDVFGELGVLLGVPISYAVTAFSDKVNILQMDCREGSPLSKLLLEEDLPLASRLFRYVASVCATRVEMLEEHLKT